MKHPNFPWLKAVILAQLSHGGPSPLEKECEILEDFEKDYPEHHRLSFRREAVGDLVTSLFRKGPSF